MALVTPAIPGNVSANQLEVQGIVAWERPETFSMICDIHEISVKIHWEVKDSVETHPNLQEIVKIILWIYWQKLFVGVMSWQRGNTDRRYATRPYDSPDDTLVSLTFGLGERNLV